MTRSLNRKFLIVGANILALSLIFLPHIIFADQIKRDVFTAGDVSNKFKTYVNVAAFFAVIASVLFIIVGGFQWMSGNAKDGQSKVKNGIIGLIVVLVAYLIVQLVAGATVGVRDSGEITAGTGGGQTPDIE